MSYFRPPISKLLLLIHCDALAWLLSLCARGHICLLLGYALTLSQSSSTLKLSRLFYRKRFRFHFRSCCYGRGDGPTWSFYRDPIEYPVGRSDLGPRLHWAWSIAAFRLRPRVSGGLAEGFHAMSSRKIPFKGCGVGTLFRASFLAVGTFSDIALVNVWIQWR